MASIMSLRSPCSCLPAAASARRSALNVVPFTAAALPQRLRTSSSCTSPCSTSGPISLLQRRQLRSVAARASPDDNERPVKYNTEFGYSRKDVIIICTALIAFGYALYYGLQEFAGLSAGIAGNWVQLIIFMGICVFWVSTYLYRVATKQMTYVKQLEAYEEAVMKKRIEEMTEAEMEQLVDDTEAERARRAQRRQQQ